MAVIIDHARLGKYEAETYGDYFKAAVDAPAHTGMVVGGVTAAGVYKKAHNTAASLVHPRGVCITNSEAANDEVDIAKRALIGPYRASQPDGALVGTPDAKVYVAIGASPAGLGEITETTPAVSTNGNVVVGHVVVPGWVLFDIGWPHVADTVVP